MAQDLPRNVFFRFFLESLELFFLKICAHSERYRNLMTGICEILTFFWQHRVFIVIGLRKPAYSMPGAAVSYPYHLPYCTVQVDGHVAVTVAVCTHLSIKPPFRGSMLDASRFTSSYEYVPITITKENTK